MTDNIVIDNIADDLKQAHDDGMWEMFQLITSAEYGKQRFFDDYHGTVYDRDKGDHLKDRDAAIDRFLEEIEEVWGSI